MYDLKGKRFDHLEVIERYPESTNDGFIRWVCKCDCGNTVVVTGRSLRNGSTRSCGCLRKELLSHRNLKHGDNSRGNRHRLYNVHNEMIRKCYDSRRPNYSKYGAKGIRVCDEWYTPGSNTGYLNFKKWSYDHGYCDEENVSRCYRMSLQRLDNNGPFSPENCIWRSSGESESHQYIRIDGCVYTFGEAERKFGVPKGTIYNAYMNGWKTGQIINRLKHPNEGLTLNKKLGCLRNSNGFIKLSPKIPQDGVNNKYGN